MQRPTHTLARVSYKKKAGNSVLFRQMQFPLCVRLNFVDCQHSTERKRFSPNEATGLFSNLPALTYYL